MSNQIKVIAQHKIPVFTLTFTAVQAEDGFFYVALADVFRGLKLNARKETKYLKKHAILKEGHGHGKITDPEGQSIDVDLLRIDLLSLWVTNMPITHLEEPLKTSVINFQREAAYLLQEGLAKGRLNDQALMADLMRRDWPQVSTFKEALGKLNIAHSQLLAEANTRRLERINL